jgi:hypothetical protein
MHTVGDRSSADADAGAAVRDRPAAVVRKVLIAAEWG